VSKIIDFLEKLGHQAELRGASAVELEQALAEAGIEPHLWAAILDMNQSRFESLLGARANVCCLIYSPDEKEDEEEEEVEEEEGEDEEHEKHEDKLKSQDRARPRVA
jgi:hypothetical protein